jgi:DnaJ-class molecular chaperone
LAVDQVVNPKTLKKIVGEGMPVYDRFNYDPNSKPERGDLFVQFEILFPRNITQEQREKLCSILSS